MTQERLFFELLQVGVENRNQLTVNPTPNEWAQLRWIADKQSLTGIAIQAIEKLPKSQRPPQDQLLDWIGQSMIIQERNKQVSEVCKKLVNTFSNDGYNSCILKGQANHAYYGEELGLLRVCGDVDIWVVPKETGSEKEDVKRVLEYVYKTFKVESLCWLHVELKPIDTVPVEVHLRPSFFNSPIRNRRFLKFFDFGKAVCQKEIDGRMLPVLKTEYDVIFQLNHIYRHLLDEGVGLRQVVDYYFVLKTRNMDSENQGNTELGKTLRYLGMGKFAGALMWVMQEVLGLNREYMICEPSEKHGQFLLNEIMIAGNFGHYDSRLASLNVKKGQLSYQIKHAWRRIKRNMRFFTSYPEEVFWEPYARMSHFAWKILGMWR